MANAIHGIQRWDVRHCAINAAVVQSACLGAFIRRKAFVGCAEEPLWGAFSQRAAVPTVALIGQPTTAQRSTLGSREQHNDTVHWRTARN